MPFTACLLRTVLQNQLGQLTRSLGHTGAPSSLPCRRLCHGVLGVASLTWDSISLDSTSLPAELCACAPSTISPACWLQARGVLIRIRGTADVDTELDDISQASAIAAPGVDGPVTVPSSCGVFSRSRAAHEREGTRDPHHRALPKGGWPPVWAVAGYVIHRQSFVRAGQAPAEEYLLEALQAGAHHGHLHPLLPADDGCALPLKRIPLPHRLMANTARACPAQLIMPEQAEYYVQATRASTVYTALGQMPLRGGDVATLSGCCLQARLLSRER